jgi:hypothetical protein
VESTLALTFDELIEDTAEFLGMDPENAGDLARLTKLVKAGVHRFYYPQAPNMTGTYEWTFLQPVASLTLAEDAQTLELPDDFGGLSGKVTVSTSSASYFPLEVRNEGQVREAYSKNPTASGRPLWVSEQVIKGTEKTRGQRYRLFFYPAADDDYVLEVPYKITANALTGDRPYCYGGAIHAETIRESCLAVAEQTMDTQIGIHTQLFNQRLVASIGLDQAHKPHRLGYNGDNSHMRYDSRFNRSEGTTVTINGSTP